MIEELIQYEIGRIKTWGAQATTAGLIRGSWRGKPLSKEFTKEYIIDYLETIDNLIKEADDTECLTSRIEYIRECKKYYMENK